ncbi:hypothetical protein TeGR_g369 [Tetraparma gracilis]|uniref:MYND-type domain-containing protein n=1 Tax=Tetraparma gracilis TaxID=2962635 RepID=A0ABQ6MX10_9STRA|nr:hypothetical protein TeGR_g369 [Tetraparma gracilis]
MTNASATSCELCSAPNKVPGNGNFFPCCGINACVACFSASFVRIDGIQCCKHCKEHTAFTADALEAAYTRLMDEHEHRGAMDRLLTLWIAKQQAGTSKEMADKIKALQERIKEAEGAKGESTFSNEQTAEMLGKMLKIIGAGGSATEQFEEVKKQAWEQYGKPAAKKLHGLNYKACAAGCGEKGEKKCSKCDRAHYCGRECQVAHWKAHKAECKAWRGREEALRKDFEKLEELEKGDKGQEGRVEFRTLMGMAGGGGVD